MRCPNCKIKLIRPKAEKEFCGNCESDQEMVEVKEKAVIKPKKITKSVKKK